MMMHLIGIESEGKEVFPVWSRIVFWTTVVESQAKYSLFIMIRQSHINEKGSSGNRQHCSMQLESLNR